MPPNADDLVWLPRQAAAAPHRCRCSLLEGAAHQQAFFAAAAAGTRDKPMGVQASPASGWGVPPVAPFSNGTAGCPKLDIYDNYDIMAWPSRQSLSGQHHHGVACEPRVLRHTPCGRAWTQRMDGNVCCATCLLHGCTGRASCQADQQAW